MNAGAPQIITSGPTYMTGILGDGGGKIYVETTNGDIELKKLEI